MSCSLFIECSSTLYAARTASTFGGRAEVRILRIYRHRYYHEGRSASDLTRSSSKGRQRRFSLSASTMSTVQQRADAEKLIKRNPHPDFAKVQASRDDWSETASWHYTKTKKPDWTFGGGANDNGESLKKQHVEIDPYAEGRPAVSNYKLLISAITPRFIGFMSTRSKDGSSTNLAPFSYTTFINHDPPVFCVGFTGGLDNAKDSLRNLIDTRECVINVISEHYIEAANACSINAPYGISEWALTGLHPAACSTVAASRVREAVFAVEGKLMETREFESRATPGKMTGVLAIIEGTRFWAREDAINDERSLIDPAILLPVSRLGGITYARTTQGFEIPRPDFEKEKGEGRLDGLLEARAKEQQ